MGLVINTNAAATAASMNLNGSNAMLQKSLNRLSSGFKINSPADDAGGLAVSMKMQAALNRNAAVDNNVGNAISYLQTQDGALKTASKILDRVSELKTLNNDVTKNSSDKANYETEFTALKAQLSSVVSETFNGVSLFSSAANQVRNVKTTEDASQSVNISIANAAANSSGIGNIINASNLAGISSVSVIQTAIQNTATLRAANGAQTSRLQFASDMLKINKTNLEAANSRIIDTDIADESTKFARFQILSQSGAAMLAQANSSSQIALRLLG